MLGIGPIAGRGFSIGKRRWPRWKSSRHLAGAPFRHRNGDFTPPLWWRGKPAVTAPGGGINPPLRRDRDNHATETLPRTRGWRKLRGCGSLPSLPKPRHRGRRHRKVCLRKPRIPPMWIVAGCFRLERSLVSEGVRRVVGRSRKHLTATGHVLYSYYNSKHGGEKWLQHSGRTSRK